MKFNEVFEIANNAFRKCVPHSSSRPLHSPGKTQHFTCWCCAVQL